MVKESNYTQLPKVRQGWLNTVLDHIGKIDENRIYNACLSADTKFQNIKYFFYYYTRSSTKAMTYGPSMHSIKKNCAAIKAPVSFMLKIGGENITITSDPTEIELYLYSKILEDHTPTEALNKYSVNKYKPFTKSRSARKLSKILSALYGTIYISIDNRPFRWYLGGEQNNDFFQEYKQLNNK